MSLSNDRTMSDLNQKTLNELKTALMKERELLTEELKTIAAPDKKLADDWDTKHFEWSDVEIASKEAMDVEENADESEEDSKNEAVVQRLELRLREVSRALARMEKGVYGIDEKTGKPISVERLRANPAATGEIEDAG